MINAIPKKVKSYNLSLSFPMGEMPLLKLLTHFLKCIMEEAQASILKMF